MEPISTHVLFEIHESAWSSIDWLVDDPYYCAIQTDLPFIQTYGVLES